MKHAVTENFGSDYVIHSVQYDMIWLLFKNQQSTHLQIDSTDVWVWDSTNCLVPIRHIKVDSGHDMNGNKTASTVT
jgi:hypothetical protein